MTLCSVLSCSVMSYSLQPHGLQPARLLGPWGFSRQEYWSGLPCLLQGIFPTQGWTQVSSIAGRFSEPLSSVQFSRSVVSNSLRPHELQHTRPPCPSPTPGAHPNSCPLSRWCHPTISFSVVPFSSCPQSFPASGYFQMSQLFELGGQSIGVSASTSDLPMNTQDGLISFRMDWLDLLAVQGTLKSLLQLHNSKASILWRSAFFIVQLSHPYVTSGKTIALTRWTFVGKVMSLLFNMLSRLIITFLPRSKRLLISWLQSPSAVILEPRKIKSATVSASICYEVMGPEAMILVFWMLSFKPTFSLSCLTDGIANRSLFTLCRI